MPKSSERIQKVAVVALKDKQVCLVTTRQGKRWVPPKGTLKRGTPAREMALQEAWEEAGLVGTVRPDPVSGYLCKKSGRSLQFTVFVMDVVKATKEWPERHQRQRRWFSPEQALAQVHSEGLRQAILQATLPGEEADWPLLKQVVADLRRYRKERTDWQISEWSVHWQQESQQPEFALTVNVAGAWASRQFGQDATSPDAAIGSRDEADARLNDAPPREEAA